MSLPDGVRAPRSGWELGLSSSSRAVFPQLLELSMSHGVCAAQAEPRLPRSGAVSPVWDPVTMMGAAGEGPECTG